MLRVIIDEMARGNFSFAILIVGIIQIIVMLRNKKRREPMKHYLKIKEAFADAIVSGDKTFEIRENDRGYQKGDVIEFHAVNKDDEDITHDINFNLYQITYVLSGWGIQNGIVALAIKQIYRDLLSEDER